MRAVSGSSGSVDCRQRAIRVYHRDRCGENAAGKVLPEPVRRDLEVGQALEAARRDGARHEDGGQLSLRVTHAATTVWPASSAISWDGLGRSVGVASGKQAIPVHDDHGFEGAGVDDLLFERRAVIADIARREGLDDGFGRAETGAEAPRIGLAHASETAGHRCGAASRWPQRAAKMASTSTGISAATAIVNAMRRPMRLLIADSVIPLQVSHR